MNLEDNVEMLKMFSNGDFIINFITAGENFNLNNLRALESPQIGIIFDTNCAFEEKTQFFDKYVCL